MWHVNCTQYAPVYHGVAWCTGSLCVSRCGVCGIMWHVKHSVEFVTWCDMVWQCVAHDSVYHGLAATTFAQLIAQHCCVMLIIFS